MNKSPALLVGFSAKTYGGKPSVFQFRRNDPARKQADEPRVFHNGFRHFQVLPITDNIQENAPLRQQV
jgi:hypothetical protein